MLPMAVAQSSSHGVAICLSSFVDNAIVVFSHNGSMYTVHRRRYIVYS